MSSSGIDRLRSLDAEVDVQPPEEVELTRAEHREAADDEQDAAHERRSFRHAPVDRPRAAGFCPVVGLGCGLGSGQAQRCARPGVSEASARSVRQLQRHPGEREHRGLRAHEIC